MDFTLIDRYINCDISVGNSEIRDLEALVATNPWFTLAYILLLKGYKNENRQNYQEFCRLTVFYAPNRRRLYNFIANETSKTSTPAIPVNKNEVNKVAVPEKRDSLLSFRNEYFSSEELGFLDEFPDKDGSLEDDLIIKFIKESPKITPRKETSTQDLDFDNSMDNSSIASETLAEIFLAQGLYEQSIECYNKLILLNPEKSIYFAAKINEIRNIKK
jgi:tetratricopeptide (TPR) repeat protein